MINQEAMNKSAVQSSNCIDHESKGLYDPHFEHDNCGIGAILRKRQSPWELNWGTKRIWSRNVLFPTG